MYNDVYNILKILVEKHWTEKFPLEEVTKLASEHLEAVQELIDKQYLFAHRFIQYSYVTTMGIEAYQQETLRRKDQLEYQRRQKAEQEAASAAERAYLDQNTKKHFRHDWWIAIFNLLAGSIIGAIADHFLDIVGNAIRFWRFLLEQFH